MSLGLSAWCQVSSVYTGIRGPLSLTVDHEYPPNPCSTPKCGEGEVGLLSLICGCQGDLYDNCKPHNPCLCQFTSCMLSQTWTGNKASLNQVTVLFRNNEMDHNNGTHIVQPWKSVLECVCSWYNSRNHSNRNLAYKKYKIYIFFLFKEKNNIHHVIVTLCQWSTFWQPLISLSNLL